MFEACHRAVSEHLNYLSSAFSCTQAEGYTGILTPYTYGDNDSIELFVAERGPGQLLLTDLGGALEHAAISCGRDLLGAHTEKIRQIANKHDLMLADGALSSICSYADVGEAMLRMAMAAKEIDSLIRLSRAQRIAKFDMRFGKMLTERGVRFLPRQRVVGASGWEYTVDFIAATPKIALIQTIGADHGLDKIARVGMAFDDLRDSHDDRPKLAVVEKTLATPKMALLRKKADEVYTQAQVDTLVSDLGVRIRPA